MPNLKYQPTYPPNTYPSTAPYSHLTNYFRDLVKDGILTRFIVKALLYPEFLREFDVSKVKMRRKHKKSLARLHRKDSWLITQTSSEEDEEYSDEDPEGSRIFCQSSSKDTETETEEDASSSDNTFSAVQYHTGRKSYGSSDQTHYESFIDHGEDPVDVIYITPYCDTNSRTKKTNIGYSTDSIPRDSRDSLLIYTSPVKLVDSECQTIDEGSPIHTTTARLKLAVIKKQASDQSSFEHQLGGHMACEDLVHVDDDMKIKNGLKQKPLYEERHSMPTYFVGNRFNQNSITEIYIPSWKDKQESREKSKQSSKKDSISTITAHSEDQVEKDKDSGEILTPPDMFKNIDHKENVIYRLPREATPFKTHTINSDKRMSIHSNKQRFSGQRISPFMDSSNACACCSNSLCDTPRSSDSGMAGSYTISSPDPPLLDLDHNCLHNKNKLPLNKFDSELKDLNNNQNNGDSGQYESNSLISKDIIKLIEKSKSESSSSTNLTTDAIYNEISHAVNTNQFHDKPNISKINHLENSEIVINLHQTHITPGKSFNDTDESDGSDHQVEIYRTGLYAHWWKKEQLPNEMVQEIVIHKADISKKQNSVDDKITQIITSDSKVGLSNKPKVTIVKKGSGKQFRSKVFKYVFESGMFSSYCIRNT